MRKLIMLCIGSMAVAFAASTPATAQTGPTETPDQIFIEGERLRVYGYMDIQNIREQLSLGSEMEMAVLMEFCDAIFNPATGSFYGSSCSMDVTSENVTLPSQIGTEDVGEVVIGPYERPIRECVGSAAATCDYLVNLPGGIAPNGIPAWYVIRRDN